MQIIAGQAKGLALKVPDGFDVRPTGARARKALFDSIGVFSGLRILDLFAGAGALGLEAASRGASKVSFIEQSSRHASFIKTNIETLQKAGVECEFSVSVSNVMNYSLLLPLAASSDIIFADPPYANSAQYLAKLAASKEFTSAASKSTLIWEMPDAIRDYSLFNPPAPCISRRRVFGSTEFLIITFNV